MKTIFLIAIVALAFATNASGQACNVQPLQSPVSKKPSSATVSMINCNEMQMQWKGNPNQMYKLNITVKDAATNKIIKTISSKAYKHDGLNYAASIAVTAGTKLNWTVQAITVISNRTFYSYPLRSKDFIVPGCDKAVTSVGAVKENAVAAKDIKIAAKLYPNPVQSILHISLESKSNTLKNITIFDAYGKTLITQRSTQNNIQADVKRLVIGSYFIRITDGGGRLLFNGKFIKQ